MTEPQDPFSTPAQPPAGDAAPGYGQPPAQGYGQQSGPAYGDPSYGGMPGTPELAPWIYRVGAAIVDGLITGVAQAIFGAINKGLGQLVGLALLLFFMYLLGTTGQTPGKKLLGIKIVKEADGTYIGFGMAVVRYIAHILDAIPLALGFLWPLWDKKNQTFADKIVGTLSIKA